jgi:hypothetical protein
MLGWPGLHRHASTGLHDSMVIRAACRCHEAGKSTRPIANMEIIAAGPRPQVLTDLMKLEACRSSSVTQRVPVQRLQECERGHSDGRAKVDSALEAQVCGSRHLPCSKSSVRQKGNPVAVAVSSPTPCR